MKCKKCKGVGAVKGDLNKWQCGYVRCPSCSSIPLTFDQLRKTNEARCNNDIRPLGSWTPLEWGACIAGETGELCNFLKKMKRGDIIDKQELAHELADIITYADLLAANLGIDLGKAVKEKFNIVSKRWKSKYKL